MISFRRHNGGIAGDLGWVAEWFKAAVLKTANPRGFVGSNPTPSATGLSQNIPFRPITQLNQQLLTLSLP